MQHPDSPGDFWLLPGGGVKPHETSVEALRRELWEETGLALKSKPTLLWRRSHQFERGLHEKAQATEQHTIQNRITGTAFQISPFERLSHGVGR